MNEKKMSIWNNGQEVMQALTPFYQEEAVSRIREANAMDSWFALLQSAGVEPEQMTTGKMAEVTPYVARQQSTQLIKNAINGGFLEFDGDGYSLTESGRAALAGFFDYAQMAISEVPVLADSEMKTAAGLLARVVEATESLPEPADRPNLTRSRWTDPGASAAPIVRVDQFVTDLYGFRDDAHIAAWKAYDVNGRTWETLTFLWREEASTAGELVEKLPRRGYDAQDYGASLSELAQKGWAEENGEGWAITKRGRGIREEAEKETDRLFFGGWETLSDAELDTLDDLLDRLLQQLKEAAPVPEAA